MFVFTISTEKKVMFDYQMVIELKELFGHLIGTIFCGDGRLNQLANGANGKLRKGWTECFDFPEFVAHATWLSLIFKVLEKSIKIYIMLTVESFDQYLGRNTENCGEPSNHLAIGSTEARVEWLRLGLTCKVYWRFIGDATCRTENSDEF